MSNGSYIYKHKIRQRINQSFNYIIWYTTVLCNCSCITQLKYIAFIRSCKIIYRIHEIIYGICGYIIYLDMVNLDFKMLFYITFD